MHLLFGIMQISREKNVNLFWELFDKLLNREYYLQILGPHTLKSILLSHLPQNLHHLEKKTYKKSRALFDMLMPTSCNLAVNLTKIPKVPP
jgi:hypothetical protein